MKTCPERIRFVGVSHREKEIIRAAMNLLTDPEFTASPPRRLVPGTTLGKWLWVAGCVVVLIPLVMVGLLLTAVAIAAVLVLGLLSLLIIAVRRFGRKSGADATRPSISPRWVGTDGRRNVRVVQRTNVES